MEQQQCQACFERKQEMEDVIDRLDETEQELADLKRLVREYLNEGLYGDTQDFRNYNSLYWKLKQAVTLATDDSKEEEL